MNKYRLALVSLVGAGPAGYLAYLIVVAFLERFEIMTNMLRGLTIVTLLCTAAMIFMPFGILIFGPKVEKEEEEDKDADRADDESMEAAEDEPAHEEIEEEVEEQPYAEEEPADEFEDEYNEAEDVYDTDDEGSQADLDFDDFMEDEEPKKSSKK